VAGQVRQPAVHVGRPVRLAGHARWSASSVGRPWTAAGQLC